jgi:hypothetical protein
MARRSSLTTMSSNLSNVRIALRAVRLRVVARRDRVKYSLTLEMARASQRAVFDRVAAIDAIIYEELHGER